MSDDELIAELASPLKSFRVFAIEKAITEGNSAPLLAALEECRRGETDDECTLLLDHAIAAVRRRLTPTTRGTTPDGDELVRRFPGMASAEKAQVLQNLARSDVRALAPHAPAWFTAETDPVVAAGLIRKLGAHWPTDRHEVLRTALKSRFFSVRTAAFETLMAIAPTELAEELPALLSSDDLRLRSLAIQGLARLDLDDAVQHVADMLAASDTRTREAGLQNSFLLPFANLKRTLLEFLANETVPKLIEYVGLLFVANPDPEIMPRLWEIAGRSPAAKAQMIRDCFDLCRRAIVVSGLLGDAAPTYFARLDRWIRKHDTVRGIRHLCELAANRELTQAAFQAFYEPLDLAQPEVTDALRQAVADDALPEPLRIAFEKLLQRAARLAAESAATAPTDKSNTSSLPRKSSTDGVPSLRADPSKPGSVATTTPPSPEPAAPAPAGPTAGTDAGATFALPSSDDLGLAAAPSHQSAGLGHEGATNAAMFSATTGADLAERLTTWPLADAQAALPLVASVIGDAEHPLRVVALRTAARLRLGELADTIKPLMNHNDDQLATAALEFIGVVDSELAIQTIYTHLKSRNPRLRTSAMRLLVRLDPVRALDALQKWAASPDNQLQDQALAAMPDFDFPSVRPLLVEILGRMRGGDRFRRAVTLFRAHPDRDNLDALWRLEQRFPTEATLLREIRRQNTEELVARGSLAENEVPQLEAAFARQLEAEQRREASPSPYSVAATRKQPSRSTAQAHAPAGPAGPGLGETLAEWAGRYSTVLIFMATVAVVFGLGQLLLPPPPPPKPASIVGQTLTIEGVVRQVVDGGASLVIDTTDRGPFVVSPEAGTLTGFAVGRRVRATVQATGIDTQRGTLARCKEIKAL